MKVLGSGVFEIALLFRGEAFRVVTAVQIADEVWVPARVSEEIGARLPDAETGYCVDQRPAEESEGDLPMKTETLDVVRGTGNVFRDLSAANPDLLQLKAILACEIIKTLNRDRVTVRAAHARTGIAAADFSRVRNADLSRFTVDCLMTILARLGSTVEVRRSK
jgi:predicted XRE-type DNA-binding protein